MPTIEVASFVDLGVECWHQGTLFDALELLAARLDLAGAGELVTEIMAVDWSPAKGTPNPTPKPPPPPPRPTPKGWRS